MTSARPLKGALLCVAGLLLFACMDATTKFLAERYPVPAIVAVRYLVNLALMTALLAPSHGRELVVADRRGLVLLRALSLAAASLFIGFALQQMPVAETTAINFLAPILVMFAARPLLGERIGRLGWAAALLGFAGVLLIARPGSGVGTAGVAFALAAVAANAAYQLLSRLLSAGERTMALTFYATLAGAVLFGLALPWTWGGPAPGALEALLFVSLGVYGGLGHYLFTAAYRYATASLLAPMTYVQLLWAVLLGWLLFGHVPDGPTALGMAVVAASGAMIALKSRAPPPRRSV